MMGHISDGFSRVKLKRPNQQCQSAEGRYCNQVKTQKTFKTTDTSNYQHMQTILNRMKMKPGLEAFYITRPGIGILASGTHSSMGQQ